MLFELFIRNFIAVVCVIMIVTISNASLARAKFTRRLGDPRVFETAMSGSRDRKYFDFREMKK